MAATLLYDADCGFCTASARWLLRRRTAVIVTPLQGHDLAAAGISQAAAREVIHAITDDGQIVTGHRAVALGLRGCPARGLRLAGRLLDLRALSPLWSRAYAGVARHRHRLPGGTDSCRLEPPAA